jgi:predicted DNA-binding transcriptional regulator AlpA
MALLLTACRIISIPTAAVAVGCSPSTLYRWAREGRAPFVLRVGSRLWASWPLLERHLAGEAPSSDDYTRTLKALRANGTPMQAAIRAVGQAQVRFSRLAPADRLASGAGTTSIAGRMRAGLDPEWR